MWCFSFCFTCSLFMLTFTSFLCIVTISSVCFNTFLSLIILSGICMNLNVVFLLDSPFLFFPISKVDFSSKVLCRKHHSPPLTTHPDSASLSFLYDSELSWCSSFVSWYWRMSSFFLTLVHRVYESSRKIHT